MANLRVHYIVTNLGSTTQRLMNHQGQLLFIEPGKSVLMHNPPKESETFSVDILTREAQKMYFEEFKTEGAELKTVVEVKAEKQEKKQLNKNMEVKI